MFVFDNFMMIYKIIISLDFMIQFIFCSDVLVFIVNITGLPHTLDNSVHFEIFENLKIPSSVFFLTQAYG